MEVKKKKWSMLGAVHRLIQIGAFVLFPGLFISTFSAIKDVYTAVISGTFHIAELLPQLILMISVLLITAMMGRFFCGFLCSFGAMGDLLWFAGRKLRLPRLKVAENVDRNLKRLKYLLLIFLVIFVWTLGLVAIESTFDPWTIFGMYASVKGWTSVGSLFTIGGALLLFIMIGSTLVERFFCRYLCPLGAIFAVISRFRLFRIKKPGRECGSCRVCTNRCAMGIPLNQSDVVTSGECIDCFACINVCPRGNVTANPAPSVAAALAVATMTGLYYAGNLAESAAAVSTESAAISETDSTETTTVLDEEQGPYIDGIYTGSASGYRGTTTVQVTVENGFITDIEVFSTGDDQEFFAKAKNTVIADILESQSVDVDAVSGATFSSNGIMDAVANALAGAETSDSEDAEGLAEAEESESGSESQAEEDTSDAEATAAGESTESNTAPDTTSDSATSTGQAESAAASEETGTAESETQGSIALADGVYTGSGTGFRGTTTVSVTVSNGVITDITVESYQDDQQYFDRAKSTVIASILEEQSVNVDAVSGATFSSNGIMEAVADALGLEYENTNSVSGGQHGGPDPRP